MFFIYNLYLHSFPQGMYFTYVVSVITTIEKLFQIKSKTSGMLLSATEIGQICTALLLTYFAGQGHRPRWIACGMFLFAVCAFGCSIPHFMFGSQLQHANGAFYGSGAPKLDTTALDGPLMMGRTAANIDSELNPFLEAQLMPNRSMFAESNYNLCRVAENGSKILERGCESDVLDEQEAHSQITYTVLVMLVFCMLGVGVGQTAVATLGIPFIDDNVASRESPIYIGKHTQINKLVFIRIKHSKYNSILYTC